MSMLRRFLVVALFAFWMGGFTFYTGVAIPVASEILGSHRAAGFITRQVTQWLNLAGVVTLAVLAWNVVADWRAATPRDRKILAGTLAFLVVAEIALLVLHPVLDAGLDPAARRVKPEGNFEMLHHVYLWISTAQWIAGLPYLWWTLVVWRRADRAAA
jgi:hypothetical protein